jgi:hypothetical protein
MGLCPIGLGDYLSSVYNAAMDIRELADRTVIERRASEVEMATPAHLQAAEDEFASWAAATPMSVAWARFVSGEVPEEEGPRLATHVCGELRRTGFAHIALGKGAAGAAAFWLQLIEHVVGPPRACFWAADGSSLMVSTVEPSTACFAGVFLGPDGAPGSQGSLRSDPEIGALESIDATVAEVMRHIAQAPTSFGYAASGGKR